MKITREQLIKSLPTIKNPDTWISLLNEFLPQYEINTINRISAFLAQAGHESTDMNVLSENLNYSWQGLRATFGSRYFATDAIAKQYHRQPEKIANHVYNDANRKSKLGNIYVGDGFKFIGRGIFQLTGRYNYEQFGKSIGMNADEVALYLMTPRGAIHSGCWYWATKNLNRHADNDDIIVMTKTINGGTNGIQDRTQRYTRSKAALAGSGVLSVGSRGEAVKHAQRLLKINADGIFGPNTKKAVIAFQKQHGFAENGVIDQFLLYEMEKRLR